MAARVQTTELVRQMSGKNTLNGWDVLVSYNEDQINELLKIRAQAVNSLSRFAFQTEEAIPFQDEKQKRNWVVELSKPRLEFIGNQGRIRLNFDLAASMTPEGAPKGWTMKPGFAVEIETDLMNVQGSLSDPSNPATAEFIPASNAADTAVRSNSVVPMASSDSAAQAVCINLADKKLSIKFVSTANPPEKIPAEVLMVNQRLTEYIGEAGFKYYVAGLNNVYKAATGADLLKPKTFCFTCTAGNTATNTPGTLCMWIGVEGGEAGTRPSGQTSMTFHPADSDLSPIPKDSSASVIFSHRLMANYIVAAMKERGVYDTFSITSNVSNTGIEIKARCNKTVKKDFSQYKINGDYAPPFGVKWDWYQDVDLNMHNDDTVFRFGKDGNLRDISVAYVSAEQTLGWFQGIVQVLGGGMPEQKTLRIKFAHGGSAQWLDDRSPGTKNPNMLKLKFTLPSKFQAKDSKVTEKILFWDKDNAEAPEHYKNIEIDLPTIDFNLRGLDYFLTTNLLLPGAHLFIADEPSGKKGANYGLFMPRDVLLTGEVAKEIKTI